MLHSSLKTYSYGQDKASAPKETIEKALSRLGQSQTPILANVIRLDTLDRINIAAYITKVLPEIAKIVGFKETYGKGITEEESKASALMELVERYSGFMYLKDREHFAISPYDKIKEKALPLANLLFSLPSYYRDNKTLETIRKVPLAWVKSYSLGQDKRVFFPLAWFYRIYGTTGWAAGNSLEEALLQALGEIIERHCISTIMEEKRVVPTINIASIDIPLIKNIIKKIKKCEINLFIKDFSLDLGIPTLAVIAHDPNPLSPTIRVYAAAGTHLNSKFALIRALNELMQHRAQILYRELIEKKPGGPTYCFPMFKELKEASFLLEGELIDFSSIPSFSKPDFKIEIEYLLDLLAKRGLEAFFVETTHKDLNLPAVIVSIPGAKLNRPSARLHPYLLIARQLMDIGLYNDATIYLKEVLDIEPHYRQIPQIICQVAVCYKMAGRYLEARQHFEQALSLAPKLIHSSRFIADFMEVIQKEKT